MGGCMAGLTGYNRPDRERETRETICDVHRDMYQILKQHDPEDESVKELMAKLEQAFKMAKSMNAKLTQYKHDYDVDFFNKEKMNWDWDELKGD